MYEFTPADPTRKIPGHEPQPGEKRTILFVYIPILGLASMMLGIIAGENQVSESANIILGLLLNLFALMWAKIDADERGYELSRYFTLAVLFLGVFAIIYYLFRSRGARGGITSLGWMVLYGLALTIVLSIISAIITIILVMLGVLPKSLLEP